MLTLTWQCNRAPQVRLLAEQSLASKDYDRFTLLVDELLKVLQLLLQLSERLARAENAILALSQNACDKEKVGMATDRGCPFIIFNFNLTTALHPKG